MSKVQYRIKETVKETEKIFEPQRKFFGIWFAIPFFSPKTFSNLCDSEKFIAYYEMIRTKTDIKFHAVESIDEYNPVPKREDNLL